MILKKIYTMASVRAVEWKLWGSDTVETKGLCFESGYMLYCGEGGKALSLDHDRTTTAPFAYRIIV